MRNTFLILAQINNYPAYSITADVWKKVMRHEYFNKKSEIELTRSGLVDFGEFFDIKYDVDSEEQVYPDVYKEIEIGSGEEKGKKKEKFPVKTPTTSTKL